MNEPSSSPPESRVLLRELRAATTEDDRTAAWAKHLTAAEARARAARKAAAELLPLGGEEIKV